MAVLLALALLLVLGWVLRLPGWIMLLIGALIWLAVVLVHVIAPGSPLAQTIGGNSRVWLVAGGVAGLIVAYRYLIGRLHGAALPPEQDAAPAPAPEDPEMLSEAELDRYARHIVLREIGGPGQMQLRGAKVLVIGAGGLGAPICLYLAAAGVGHVTVADDDRVSLSNLQRQVIFRMTDLDRPKVQAARDAMLALNPHISVTALDRRIGAEDADLIAGFDLVLDGTDSFAGRAAINRACVAASVPLIAGAIGQWEGQVTLYDPARGGPCLDCIFPQEPAPGTVPSCAEAGVIGALPGVIGSVMALEAIKHLTGAGQGLRGRMLIYDGLYGENRMIAINSRPDCATCGPRR